MEDTPIKDLLIVVPYRNREVHLEHLLKYSPPYFKQQDCTFDFLLCELDQGGDWNAGLTSNSLIKFINYDKYKWVFIHHVDLWPCEGKWEFPPDKIAYCHLGDYGSCLMKMKDFLSVGGFSNNFWGWGGEDNDLFQKLQKNGIQCKNCSNHIVKFDTRFQNHERKFNGQNYAGGIKVLMTSLLEKNDIYNFDQHAEVTEFKKIEKNIFYQKVVPKKVSPSDYKCKKAIISYVEKQTNFLYACAFVKSACIYSAYDYDIVIIIGDKNPDKEFVEQLRVHGAKVIITETPLENIYLDRFNVYKEVLLNNPQYEHVLHVDFNDVYFQDNPFIHLKPNKLTFTTEDILIENESWNSNILKTNYGKDIFEQIKQKYTICSGVIGGPRDLFIELCDAMFNEVKNIKSFDHKQIGIDQPLVNKMIYNDKFLQEQIYITDKADTICIHMHAHKHYSNEVLRQVPVIRDKVITNNEGIKYSIVHQYNRDTRLYNDVIQHFNRFFMPV